MFCNWKSASVSPPAQACQDLPPASHSGLGAGGLAGRQTDGVQLSSVFLSRLSFVQGFDRLLRTAEVAS